MHLPITLDDFTFDQTMMEMPDSLAGIGGETSIAQHDFPGGTRTHQVFGAFPEAIKWRARFTTAQTLTRVALLRAKLGSTTEQILSWGDRSWAGRLVRFSPVARSTWLFDYECEFWARQDLSLKNGAAFITAQAQAAGQSAILQLQILSLTNLVSSAINGTLNLATLFPLVAPQLLGPVGSVVTTAGQALLNAGGLITAISAQDSLATLAATKGALAVATPLSQSSDPTISSPAADVAAYVQSIQNLIATAAPAPQWTLNVINPNLPRLAAQYLGDATRWQEIGTLNGITDPQPTGQFSSLMIPPP